MPRASRIKRIQIRSVQQKAARRTTDKTIDYWPADFQAAVRWIEEQQEARGIAKLTITGELGPKIGPGALGKWLKADESVVQSGTKLFLIPGTSTPRTALALYRKMTTTVMTARDPAAKASADKRIAGKKRGERAAAAEQKKVVRAKF